MTPGKMSSSERFGALLDEQRPHDVVDCLGHHGDDEEPRRAPRRARRVEPDHARHQGEERPELGDAEHEDDCGDEAHERDPEDDEPDRGERRLHSRGDDDPEGDGADGLPRQHDDRLAAVSREPPEKRRSCSAARSPPE